MTSATAERGTSLLYRLLAEAKKYPDAIVMGRGDPDFATPPHVVAAARDALANRAGESSPPEGLLAARQAIAERMARYNQVLVDPAAEVVVTNGGQEAISLMTLALLDEGDEILVPEPTYNTYRDAIAFARATAVGVPTPPDEAFRIDPERVRQAITPRTRALLLISPGNPTAAVIAPDDVRALAQVAAEHDLAIISDEIYDRFLYEEAVHTSPAALAEGRGRTLTLNALSKSFAMTGWRLGWVVGPAALIACVKQLKAAISGPTSIVSQYAALAALTGPQDSVDEMRAVLTRRRQIVLDGLDAIGARYARPMGGQFVFADFGFTGLHALELAQRILEEQHVMVSPGSTFGPAFDHFVRLTFLQPEDRLREAMARIARVVARG